MSFYSIQRMKPVNMDDMILIHSGDGWIHEQPPCNRQMIRYLERNEGIVSWIQPKSGGVSDQFPVIRIGIKHYTLSLRMMKAIWRHVRLKKGFVNIEKAPFGGMKLKIPSLLFIEKMRTQSRFNVRVFIFYILFIISPFMLYVYIPINLCSYKIYIPVNLFSVCICDLY